MFAKAIRVAAAGATVCLGWVTILSPGAARAVPPRMPQDTDFTCPDIAGINYVADPNDANAYYLCVDGLPQHHYQCPPVTKLIMTTPPRCIPWSSHHMP
ncbi:MAG: hypothetical protein QJR12_01975 [Mycobacterium sp.]|uniref:hypothetical protein n=1 Tax=Mycobacterium sp. TaxID=1785 RepID=UPI00262FF53D|nr:hypothetical protein [Mycobacterium sp.]MDI3313078.1 hypothetical protein [Mycobacterium sp.]